MGTRSLTVFRESDGSECAVMYRQFDGYPTGHGADLAKILAPLSLVNGLSGDASKVANGIGCLAAQVVKGMKDGAGGVYLYPSGTRDCGEDYIYIVEADGVKSSGDPKGGIRLTVQSARGETAETVWSGNVRDFDPNAVEALVK